MEGYHLPPVLFTEDEANALITIERLAVKNKDESLSKSVSSALEKIKAILKYSQKGNVELLEERIVFGENRIEEKSSDNLMQIQSAIINFKVLRIQYLSSEEKRTTRDIEPFAIYSIHGNFLLIAFCRLRDDFRVFRIDYIESLVEQNDTFTAHKMTMREFFEKYIQGQEHP